MINMIMITFLLLATLTINTVNAQHCGTCDEWQQGDALIGFQGTSTPVQGNSLLSDCNDPNSCKNALTFGVRWAWTLQTDGNLILTDNGIAIWQSGTSNKGTAPYSLIMQDDGNLVIYDTKHAAIWASNTYAPGVNENHCVMLKNDRSLVMYDSLCNVVWSQATAITLPSANGDGTCNTDTILSGDTCDAISSRNDLTNDMLLSVNTFQNLQCGPLNLFPGTRVCISQGTIPPPPLPDGNNDGTCIEVTVGQDQTCDVIAAANGITTEALVYANTGLDCNSLIPGQYLCVSKGHPVDHKPKPNSDGSCYAYTVQEGDSCTALQMKYTLTESEIDGFNTKVFKYHGCTGLWVGDVICLSDGTPPRPPIVVGTSCGVQNVNDKSCPDDNCCSIDGYCGRTSDFCLAGCQNGYGQCGEQWIVPPDCDATHPCPLGACCDKWGFCGMTDEFCAADVCVSQCSPMPLTSCAGQTRPRKQVGYYASWSSGWSCQRRLPEDLQLQYYTHVIYAFAELDPNNWQIAVTTQDVQLLSRLVAHRDATSPETKIMIAVGGWSMNDPPKSAWFRTMVQPGNRGAFISSVVDFLATNRLDGIDIDWEYPVTRERNGLGTEDTPDDAPNFVGLLQDMRNTFGSQYIVSATFPSGYWYLKNFPISAMSPLLDMLNLTVKLTFDLCVEIERLWDANIKDQGAYVRPHTDIRDVQAGIDLIRRGGGDPSKINIGIGFYGRVFQLQDPSCTTPGCPFAGLPDVGACAGDPNEPGPLAYFDIQTFITTRGGTINYVPEGGYVYSTYPNSHGGVDWVGYDDVRTLQSKLDAIDNECAGGYMVWSIDQDVIENGVPRLASFLAGKVAQRVDTGNHLIYEKVIAPAAGSSTSGKARITMVDPHQSIINLMEGSGNIIVNCYPDETEQSVTVECASSDIANQLTTGTVVRLPSTCAGGAFARVSSSSINGNIVNMQFDFNFEAIKTNGNFPK
ncbi:hypothetical protein HDU76_003439, partial [Blyttiomyces sp. JEL0837]